MITPQDMVDMKAKIEALYAAMDKLGFREQADIIDLGQPGSKKLGSYDDWILIGDELFHRERHERAEVVLSEFRATKPHLFHMPDTGDAEVAAFDPRSTNRVTASGQLLRRIGDVAFKERMAAWQVSKIGAPGVRPANGVDGQPAKPPAPSAENPWGVAGPVDPKLVSEFIRKRGTAAAREMAMAAGRTVSGAPLFPTRRA